MLNFQKTGQKTVMELYVYSEVMLWLCIIMHNYYVIMHNPRWSNPIQLYHEKLIFHSLLTTLSSHLLHPHSCATWRHLSCCFQTLTTNINSFLRGAPLLFIVQGCPTALEPNLNTHNPLQVFQSIPGLHNAWSSFRMGFGIWPQFSVNGTLIEASICDHTKIDQEFVQDVSKLCQTCILQTVHLALSEIRKSDCHHRLTSMIREQNVRSVCYNILVLF